MKTKMAFLAALAGVMGHFAMADSLSGTYRVQGCLPSETLQRGTIEHIDAQAAIFTQNLDLQGQGQSGEPFSALLTAKIGDTIARPTPELVKEGYTSTDRQIASYNDKMDTFVFNEYLYDMNLPDAQGLAQGPIKTVTIRANEQGLSYELKYRGGEHYNCTLIRQ